MFLDVNDIATGTGVVCRRFQVVSLPYLRFSNLKKNLFGPEMGQFGPKRGPKEFLTCISALVFGDFA